MTFRQMIFRLPLVRVDDKFGAPPGAWCGANSPRDLDIFQIPLFNFLLAYHSRYCWAEISRYIVEKLIAKTRFLMALILSCSHWEQMGKMSCFFQ